MESSWIIPKFRTDTTTVSGNFFFVCVQKWTTLECYAHSLFHKCDDVGSIFLVSSTIFKRNIFSEKIRENLVFNKKIPRIWRNRGWSPFLRIGGFATEWACSLLPWLQPAETDRFDVWFRHRTDSFTRVRTVAILYVVPAPIYLDVGLLLFDPVLSSFAEGFALLLSISTGSPQATGSAIDCGKQVTVNILSKKLAVLICLSPRFTQIFFYRYVLCSDRSKISVTVTSRHHVFMPVSVQIPPFWRWTFYCTVDSTVLSLSLSVVEIFIEDSFQHHAKRWVY